jgi:hypothetical protein
VTIFVHAIVCQASKMLTVLYKNASRVGYYIDIRLHAASSEYVDIETSDDVFGFQPTGTISRVQLVACDDEGRPQDTLPRHSAPEIYFRSDRGPWSIFHEKTSFLVNDHDTIQVCTKESSNICKRPMRLVFGNFISDMFLVLSKPPAKVSAPFARFHLSPKVLDSLKSDPVPCRPSEQTLPWPLQIFGAHRPAKRTRTENGDAERISELEAKLASANKTILGMQNAIKLLSRVT